MFVVISAPVAILWGNKLIHKQKYQNITITVTICEKSDNFGKSSIFVYMTPVSCIKCIINFLNYVIARAIFLSFPAPRNELYILDKRRSDCTHLQVDITVEHDKQLHKSELSLENNSCHMNRQSDQYHYCENVNTL